jgi:Na+/proline symporter
MTIFSQGEGLIMLILYGLLMVFISIYILKPSNTKDNYLVADRNVGFWQSGFSVAATWIWAPALFIATQKAYQQGIAGLFWFTVPNIACLIIFSYFAIKLREMFPKGYTLSQFILQTYSPRVQKLYLVELIGLAICQFAVQLLAGGAVISYLTGLDFFLVTLILTGIAFAYSFISGIRASILTDYWQMWLILGVVVVIVPWIVGAGGGFETIWNGLGGISGQYRNPFNFDVFYGFGIAVTIGLLAGPFGDQSFWQRAFSIKEGQVKKAFYTSAIVFGIVPILTGLIGFVAAGLGIDSNGNAQLINVITAQQLLPVWVLVHFTIMLLSGLVSTLDSSLCAISSLTGHDIATMFKSENTMWYAKIGMMFLAVFGLVIANIPDMKILYLFLFYGTLRASTLLPTVLTIWKGKLSESGVFWGICTALFVGAPMMAYGNFGGGLHFQVWGAIFTCLSSGAIAWFMTDANIKEKTLR